MFGYVSANLHDLRDDEQRRYRAAYCGLCRALRERYGQASRFGLTYDMTFLALLLGSLYEPPEQAESARCALHPTMPQHSVRTRYTDYAADLTVAFIYHKCLDDWADDRSVPKRLYAGALASAYRKARERIPRQCAAIEDGLRDIAAIEQDPNASPDAAANRFGTVLGEAFVCEPDMWAATLRGFGEQLGRFVYFMDAACDLEKDRKTGSYNPLAGLTLTESEETELLMTFAGRAAKLFEMLPLEQDLHLLRSVLYSGIWQKRNAQKAKEAKKDARKAPREFPEKTMGKAKEDAPRETPEKKEH